MRTRAFATLAMLLTALVAISSLVNISGGRSLASSHREAPLIAQDPEADATDLYAFVSPDKPDTVTLIANYVPFEDPAGGPNFYRFGDDVAYDINIDNNGDAKPDITYRFNFTTKIENPNTFLYNTGAIESLDSKNWNIRQSYTITRIDANGANKMAFEGRVPPVNIGPKSTPNYEKLAESAIGEVNGIKVFAGQRDDPFWVDLGGTFDLLTIRKLPGNQGGGVDDLAGFNTQSIAMQIPIKDLTSGGDTPTDPKADDAVIGIWTTASRFSTTVVNADGSRKGSGDLVQVSRLGMPLVNEVVVPLGAKDLFNASQPKDDAQFLAGVTKPELPGLLNALYKINVPQGDRNDLVAVFLTGVDGLNKPAKVTPSEMMRLNVAIPPAKPGKENRLGVLGGDTAGFPNGRRLADDIVDIELRVVAGVLVDKKFDVAPNNALGDGSDYNDVPFLDHFPYVAPPHQGFEHVHQSYKDIATGGAAGSPAATAEGTAAANSVTINLDELNNSGVSGTATLTAEGSKTHVVIKAKGATGDHPAHIHKGTCKSLDPNPAYPLKNVDKNGNSDTTVDVSLDDLTSGQYAINVHKSAKDIGTYVMCGNITK